MYSIRSFTRHYPMIMFFGMAYALSWWPYLFGMEIGLFAFGPLIAALLTAWLGHGKDGLKMWRQRVIQWRGNWWWYILAIILPFGINFAAAALTVLSGAKFPAQETIGRWPELLVTFPLYLVVFGPLGEEPGWRGFAMPHIEEKHRALPASLILGIFVAIWHLPLILSGIQPAAILLAVISAQVMYTWLANQVDGKVLIVMLAHAAQGGLGGEYFGAMFSGADQALETWFLVGLQCAVAIAIALWAGSRLSGRQIPGAAIPPASQKTSIP